MGVLQTEITIFNAAGLPGEFAFASPQVVHSYIIDSDGTANRFGYAYTVTSGGNPNPATDSGVAGIARVGGSGVFAGILVNPKEHPLYGTALGGPFAPALTIPDNTVGALATMGEINVNLPGPASVGDLVTYDAATGALNTIAPLTRFTGSIAAGGSSTADVLTVSAVSAGKLSVGQPITGAGIPGGTYIASLGTGKGYTGTYNLSTINTLTVSSEAMTSPNVPAEAFSVTASIAPGSPADTAGSVMTVSAVGSGQLRIGDQVFGTGIPDNTVIAAFGTGVGGTGTYVLNQVNLTVGSGTVTGPANTLIPGATVQVYTPNSTGGVAVIRLA